MRIIQHSKNSVTTTDSNSLLENFNDLKIATWFREQLNDIKVDIENFDVDQQLQSIKLQSKWTGGARPEWDKTDNAQILLNSITQYFNSVDTTIEYNKDISSYEKSFFNKFPIHFFNSNLNKKLTA